MKYAITGGIGCGKSYVCQRLAVRGIRVYDCDEAAKRLLRNSVPLQRQLQDLVGEETFVGHVLQKRVLAQYILQSEQHAHAVDAIVHPAVAQDFEQSGYDWLESAIFFDSGFDQLVSIDKVICVTAPLEVRITRIMRRDGISREQALGWIRRQLPPEEVVARSDYEIVNDGVADIDQQLNTILYHQF
ncbi:MAG: dephospho-CoA kinase [Prevotella sp.]|jgi:dephospho-CoA kinase|nr:dephospho-CoA kinase [Prevotella sp.]MCI2080780.1 dephospho-CoA kinase [Prevotella sp.]MCI2102695.1 dephospho-CoA kinase [Prevotella sp.]HCN52537.1 dephospho-CoA kinase [Prevotella sp.]